MKTHPNAKARAATLVTVVAAEDDGWAVLLGPLELDTVSYDREDAKDFADAVRLHLARALRQHAAVARRVASRRALAGAEATLRSLPRSSSSDDYNLALDKAADAVAEMRRKRP